MSHPLYDPSGISDEDIHRKMGELMKRMTQAHQAGNQYALEQLRILYEDLQSTFSERAFLKNMTDSSSVVIETDPDMKKKNDQEQAAKTGAGGKTFGGKAIRRK